MTDCKIHESHDHVHGPNCGHQAIMHDGHVDYLHDGHLHHPKGDGTIEEHALEVKNLSDVETAIATAKEMNPPIETPHILESEASLK